MSMILTVAVPVFAIILLGWAAGRIGVLGAAASDALNRFVYWFAIPPLLFMAMARTPIADIIRPNFIAAFLIGTYIVALLSAVIGRLVHREVVPRNRRARFERELCEHRLYGHSPVCRRLRRLGHRRGVVGDRLYQCRGDQRRRGLAGTGRRHGASPPSTRWQGNNRVPHQSAGVCSGRRCAHLYSGHHGPGATGTVPRPHRCGGVALRAVRDRPVPRDPPVRCRSVGDSAG